MLYYHKLNSTDVNPIPKTFTSDTSISGYVCSASTEDSSNLAWRVWKQDYTTSEWAWWTGSVTVSESNPCWVQIQVPDAFVPSSITTWNEVSTPANYQTAVFQGSNDGTTWTDIVQMPANVNTASYKNTAVCSTNTAFSYFRLYITASYAGSNGVSIQAIKITKKQYSSDGFSADFHHAVGYESAYDAGCGLSRIPTEGLVLYAPLQAYSATAETGQPLTYSSTDNFVTFDGQPCWKMYGNTITTDQMLLGATAFSISFYIDFANITSNPHILSQYSYSDYWYLGVDMNRYGDSNIYFHIRTVDTGAYGSRVEYKTNQALSTNQWHHVGFTYSATSVKCYIDGVCTNEFSGGAQLVTSADSSSGFQISGYDSSNRYIHSLRIYNRALTSDEIAQLAAEFTPTA